MNQSPLYVEGDLFLVPLIPSGFARGVLARSNGKGKAFGYFFGPSISEGESVHSDGLSPADAVLVCRFGDHGLHHGKWPVVGRIPNWSRSIWKLPRFARPHDLEKHRYLCEYSDSLEVVSEFVVSSDDRALENLPRDVQLGSNVVEAKLSKLLAGAIGAK